MLWDFGNPPLWTSLWRFGNGSIAHSRVAPTFVFCFATSHEFQHDVFVMFFFKPVLVCIVMWSKTSLPPPPPPPPSIWNNTTEKSAVWLNFLRPISRIPWPSPHWMKSKLYQNIIDWNWLVTNRPRCRIQWLQPWSVEKCFDTFKKILETFNESDSKLSFRVPKRFCVSKTQQITVSHCLLL